MQRDENLLQMNNGQQIDTIHVVTVSRLVRSTPADPVYWTFIQTGRRSDPGFESVVTLIMCWLKYT